MGTDLKVQWRRTILLRWSTKTNCTTLMINYFQEQYKEAIDASRKQLDAMFTRTYGSFYQSHTQDEIREDNSDCSKSSLALRAFGDIPLKMVRQLERSLGAARSLTHALKSSSDILQDILQIVHKCLRKDSGQSLKREIASFKASPEPLTNFSVALTDVQSQLLTSFIGKIEESRGFWKTGPRFTCINSAWSATTSDDTCWDGTKIVNNLKTVVEVSNGGVFLTERLKLMMLSNRLLESYEGKRLYNEKTDVDVEASGNGNSYIPVDDEDGDEFWDEGSGFDENQAAVVVDVAGSHRDIIEPLGSEESDLSSSSTSATKLNFTLQLPDVQISKISPQKIYTLTGGELIEE
uniref:Helo_like_N domain-containing protein n=1 Tax=Loa loa TaxID=7209 RepID=A0A1I7W276_LOALO